MNNLDDILVALTIAFTLFLLAFIPIGSYMSCDSKAKAMRMRFNWGPVQGCIIEHKPGQWIPLENYRALEK